MDLLDFVDSPSDGDWRISSESKTLAPESPCTNSSNGKLDEGRHHNLSHHESMCIGQLRLMRHKACIEFLPNPFEDFKVKFGINLG
jgi:hypothetical protein